MKTDQNINQKNSIKLKLSTTLVKYIALATVISALVFVIVFLINNLISNKDAVADNQSKGEVTVSIGTNSSGAVSLPINRYFNHSVYEVIYLKNEIANQGNITKLALDKFYGKNNVQINNLKIYMKHTSDSQFSNGNYSTSGYTLVYSGSFPNSALGWNEITLNTAFAYNNSDNLQVLFVKEYEAWTSKFPYHRYTNKQFRARYTVWDNGPDRTYLSRTNYMSNIKFTITTTSTTPTPPSNSISNPIAGQLYISEYAGKGYNNNSADEFIELYNLSDETIDLSNCSVKLFEKLNNGSTVQKGATLQLSGTVSSEDYYVIAVKNLSGQPTSALQYDIQAPVGWELKNKRFVQLFSSSTIIDNAGKSTDYMQNKNYERTDVLADGTDVDLHWEKQDNNVSSPGTDNISDNPIIQNISLSSNFTLFGANGNITPAIKIKSKGSIHPGNTKVEIKRGKEHKDAPSGKTMIKRYVKIDPTNQPDNVEFVFYYNDSELNGLTEATLGLFSYYNDSWHSQGGGVDVVNNTITVNSVNHFSDWTAGENDGGGLPINLISFNVKYNGKSVDLTWSTASEINNDYFTIERSQDAENYEIVGTVKGAGNSSNTLNYIYNDNTSLTGTVYYKLKQTDFNGKFEYFPPVAVNIASDENPLNISSVGPNPFNNEFNVEFETQSSEPIIVYLYNMRGQMVYKDIYSPAEGKNRYTYNDNKNLPAGYYVIAMKQKDTWAKGIKLLKR